MSINTILNLSDDQLNSQYQILFPTGIPGGGSGDNLVLRMDQPIQIPRESTGEYEFYYKGMKIVRPSMMEDTDKHMTLNFRIDQQWTVFEDIKNWKRMVHDPINGTRMPIAMVSCPMLFQALDGSQKVVQTCTFSNVVIQQFEVTSFEPNGTDPSRIEIQVIYGTSDWA